MVGTRTLDVLTPTLSAEPPAARFSFLGRGKIFLPLGKFSFLGRENPSFFDSVAKRVLAGSLSILAVVVFFPLDSNSARLSTKEKEKNPDEAKR